MTGRCFGFSLRFLMLNSARVICLKYRLLTAIEASFISFRNIKKVVDANITPLPHLAKPDSHLSIHRCFSSRTTNFRACFRYFPIG